METSLLKTKLNVPPARPGLVARPRLIERLKEGLNYNSVLVSAPAGFGKTTLVSEWIRDSERRVPTAWLSLEEADNDPVRFWDYFIAALETIQPTVGDASLALLYSSERVPTEAILTPLINDLSRISTDFVLVLDDYHFIQSDPVHQGLSFFLEHIPLKMHLVIATRVDPPLSLARLRGRGTILEIGADDLRFTLEEATALLTETLGPALSAEHVKALNERTEGWAVGLKMAALSIGKRKDVDSFNTAFTGSQRYVMDYLVEEVLKQTPDDARDFMLKTSVLVRFTAPLCDAITGLINSQKILVKLESSFGGFLIPLDESRQWYRYHHIFAELLLHELEAMSNATELAELRRRASQWYEENGFPDEAIQQALAARDWERAMELLYSHSDIYTRRKEFQTLLDWYQAIPEDILRSHPRLYGQYARALIDYGFLDAGEAILNYLEKNAEASAVGPGELASYRAIAAMWRGDLRNRVEYAEKALTLLPSEDLDMRAIMTLLLGVSRQLQSRFEEASLLLTDAREMARRSGDSWIQADAAGRLSNILYLQGRLHQSLTAAQEAVDLVGHSSAALMPLASVCTVLFELNDLIGVDRAARLGIELSQTGGQMSHNFRVTFHVLLAFTLFFEGDIAGANAAMRKADETASLLGGVATHAATHVLFDLMKGDFEAARQWGAQLSKYPEGTLDAVWRFVPVRLLIASGEKVAAAERLRKLYDKAIETGAYGSLVMIRVYQALAAGTAKESLAFLADALARGKPEGYIRSFADEGKLVAPLLRQAIHSGIETEYARKLLAIIEAEEQRRQVATAKRVPIPQSAEFLSQRELEILRLAAEGLSNRQIAEKLTVTLSTAKAHLHNITRKLRASTRTQAIARARDFRLI